MSFSDRRTVGNMFHGTILPDFGNIWRELQMTWEGGENCRVSDDETEKKFWRQYISQHGPTGPDPYSRNVWKEINNLLGDTHYGSILEIGPGWGNYTFDLAEHCVQLTCVDISPTILRFIKDIGSEHVYQIATENTKWEDFKEQKFDIVFGFNCFYRMKDIENCLAKIDRCGTKLHIIGMTSGPEQEFLIDFEKELGLQIRYHRLDYIVLINVLYQMGIDCNVRIVDLEKEYSFASLDSALDRFSRRIITKEYDPEEAKKIMKRYFHKTDDGFYHYIHHFKGALIYW